MTSNHAERPATAAACLRFLLLGGGQLAGSESGSAIYRRWANRGRRH
ncbi:MAG: hypothetical protein GTO03_16465 [Planctomycetales bacterium]|nr:hypothetical protein [Planctomycetales bacterium]